MRCIELLEVDQEIKQRCFQLFSNASSPLKARLAYMKPNLGMKNASRYRRSGAQIVIVSLCSISTTAWLCQNGPDACLKAVEFIDNENVEQKIASICQ